MTNLPVIAERLQHGETVSFRPRGQSMIPYIRSGNLVTVRPVDEGEVLLKGMTVLAKVRGNYYLHFIRATARDRVLIGRPTT